MFKGSKTEYEIERDYYQNYINMFDQGLKPYIQMRGEYRCKNGSADRPEHMSYTVNILKKPFPIALALNLTWD